MNRRSALLFAGLGIAWGVPYLFIAIAVTELQPSVLVLARTALGALLLVPLALARREVLAALRRWPALLAYTATEVLVPWLLLARAERSLPSSTTALLIAAVPLVGLLVGAAARRAGLDSSPHRPLGARGALGLGVGTLGVAALVGVSLTAADPVAVLEMAVVVVCYAVGAWVLGARLHDVPSVGVMACSLALAALVYLPVVLLGPGLPAQLPSASVVVAVVVLGVVCTAGAFLLFGALVSAVGPVRTTTVVYVNPLVAVVAGAVVLGERLTGWTAVGAALVLAGSVLATAPPRRRATPETAPAAV
ncbi:DMT family transporter [Quadrisphaera sp. INWT6]|uniref:DMT family transporter n=1 Tax=Quadrisphaera sp. INWT6 TaxID=2596917 RepID=UPI0018920894|nr:DMT family transporter [Quadrisphaera sp. INWT6]MBF5081086.1 DMT family transporter [Quadrisphaera sp. INWT6]